MTQFPAANIKLLQSFNFIPVFIWTTWKRNIEHGHQQSNNHRQEHHQAGGAASRQLLHQQEEEQGEEDDGDREGEGEQVPGLSSSLLRQHLNWTRNRFLQF